MMLLCVCDCVKCEWYVYEHPTLVSEYESRLIITYLSPAGIASRGFNLTACLSMYRFRIMITPANIVDWGYCTPSISVCHFVHNSCLSIRIFSNMTIPANIVDWGYYACSLYICRFITKMSSYYG